MVPKLLLPTLILAAAAVNQVLACPHGEVRLGNTTAGFQGALEVCVAGRWNGVCSDRRSSQEAIVACRQLGCAAVFTVSSRRQCPESVTKFSCSGEETQLLGCVILNAATCSGPLVDQDMCIITHCSSCETQSGLLPYGDGIDLQVPKVDDGSSDNVTFQQSFQFFGEDQRVLYVNTNGVLSFRGIYTQFAPEPVPFDSVPLIIPFWRDVDIRCTYSGNIYYRVAYDMATLQQARLLLPRVRATVEFDPTFVFVATWHQVYPYDCLSVIDQVQNTFQVVLLTDGHKSFASFLYQDIQWGSNAQIGFNNGKGNKSFSIPEALTTETLHVETLSNVGRPGVFVFQVDGNQIRPPGMSVLEHPTQLIVSRISVGSVQLNWTDTQTGVEHYNVYCYQPSCRYCSHVTTPSVLQTRYTTAIVSELSPNTEYECCVTSQTSSDESNCSEPLRVSTLPAPPNNTLVTSIGITSLTLSWTEPAEAYRQAPLNYSISCTPMHPTLGVEQVYNTSALVTGLRSFTKYKCCVVASNIAGKGNDACVEARTKSAPPTKPEGISVISTAATSLTLSWMEPVESYGQDVLFYAINCTSTKHSFELEMVHNTTITIETSRANTNYSCCISARNSVGFGGDECITVVTAEGTPTNITAFSILEIAVTTGVLSSLLLLMAVIISVICCCWCKRQKSKQSKNQNQQSTAGEVIYDIPADVAVSGIGSKGMHTTRDATSTHEHYITQSKSSHKTVECKEAEIRYDKPILASKGESLKKKQPMLPGKSREANSHYTPSTAQGSDKVDAKLYQPLILAKTSDISDYQDLTFRTKEKKHYEIMKAPDEPIYQNSII